jgi:signal peptidase I
MSDSEQRLPVVTLPSFAAVVADLFLVPVGHSGTATTSISFRADGQSMYPSIRDGESIIVEAVDTDRIVRGDILLCRHGGRVLAHRVVDLSGFGPERVVRLRGDAKGDCDAPIAASSVIGRVTSVRRGSRTSALAGRWARLRYRARTVASRAKMLAVLVCVAQCQPPQTRER